MAEDPGTQSSSDDENADFYKNPMKRRIHDIQKLNLQNREMIMMAGHNKQLAQAIIRQRNMTRTIQQSQTKVFANKSLCGCTTTNRFRSFVMQIVFNPWFDRVILLTIFANCVSLAVEDPSLPEPDPLIEVLDICFLIIFSIEMVLKIIAMGFVMQQFSYLRDAWNVLDFLVVVLGWVSLSASSSKITAIRVIRILRPLRTLNSVQGMRALVLTLLNSLPSILNIMLLFAFTLIIFGTIGVQLFKGYFQGRCVLNSTIAIDDDYSNEIYLHNRDDEVMFCQIDKRPAFECPETYTCLVRGNPDVGLNNWDNIFVSVLTQFELITLEGWSDVMYKVRNASGGSTSMDIFFIISVVFGAFFVLNLMIAVQYQYLSLAFSEINDQKEKDRKLQAQEKKENEQQKEKTKQIMADHGAFDYDDEQQRLAQKWENCKRKTCPCCYVDYEKVCCSCWLKMAAKLKTVVTSTKFTLLIVSLILLNSLTLATEHYEQPDWLTQTQEIANLCFTLLFFLEMVLSMIGLGLKTYCQDGFNIFDAIIVFASLIDLAISLQPKDEGSDGEGYAFITVLRGFRLLRIFKLIKSWTTLQQLLKTIISSMSSTINLAVLSLLFLFVYSLIGKQYFHGDMEDLEGEITRYHFNTTLDSMITMFIVLTGENWNWVMRTVIHARPEQETLAIFFFVSAMLIGNTMLLNMFLAIMLKFLEEAVDEVQQSDKKERERQQQLLQDDQRKAIEISKQREKEFHDKIYVKEAAQKKEEGAASDQNIPINLDLVNGEKPSGENPFDQQAASRASGAVQEGDQPSQASGRILNQLNEKESIAGMLIQQPAEGPSVGDSVSHAQSRQGVNESRQSALKKAGSEQSILRQKTVDQGQLRTQKTVNFSMDEKNDNLKQDDAKSQKKGEPDKNQAGKDGQSQAEEQKGPEPKKRKRLSEIIIDGNSLGCISEKNRFRIALGKFAENPYFDAFVYNLIGLNSLFLALEEPLLKDEYSVKTIAIAGDIISLLFLLECVIKVIVMGLVRGKYTYLKDNYNKLDFIIVIFSVISYVLERTDTGIEISYLKALRALRALRPLKLVSKNEGMKLVVNSILASIPNLINVFLISILFYFVFGVMGLQMLMGRVSYCLDESGLEAAESAYKLDKDECLAAGHSWILPKNNYNNVLASMTTFFEVSTLETWPDIMFSATNSQDEIDKSPIVGNRKWISLLFISFIFVTTFFVMNLFISVIVGQFNAFKQKSEGSASLSEEQREWVKIQRFMAEVRAPVKQVEPQNPLRLQIYKLVTNDYFDYFITFIIALNTITMCMDYYGASEELNFALDTCNLIFVFIFSLEALLKILGLGIRYYFYIDWNKFDFAVVIMSLISLGDNDSFNLTALRIIRVARLLRMIKSSKDLQALLKTLYLAMNNILIVATLFMLIIFTYAVAGMTLFGEIDKGEMINLENLNFKSFYLSINALIRSATGESWNQIMHDCVQEKGWIAQFYWMTFQLATFFIFLNVFIAVIYEEFQNVHQVESTLEVLSLKKRDISSFLETWGEFNEGGQTYMATNKFVKFIRRLPAPLGYRGLNIDKNKLDKIIFCLNIRDHEGQVYLPEVMWAIFYSIVGRNDKELHQCKPMRNIMRKVKDKYSGLSRNTTLDQLCGNKFYRNEMTVTKYLCGKIILENLKILRKRRLDREAKDQGKSSLGSTTVYLKKQQMNRQRRELGYFSRLWQAITRKPDSMSTKNYRKKQIIINKDDMRVIAQQSVYSSQTNKTGKSGTSKK